MNLKLIIVGSLFTLISCGPDQVKSDDNGSETSFAVNQQWSGNSVLKTISSTAGIEICISFRDQVASSQLQTEARNAVSRAVIGWNGLLNGMTNPVWNISYPKTSFVSVGSGTCTQFSASVVKFNIWQQESRWTAQFPTQRSHARPWERTVNISPNSLNAINYVVTHEYGHLLGLGDTYTISGQLEPHDQPVSMMQIHNNPFTADDVAGVRAVWRFIKTGGFSCGSGYRTGGTRANTFNYNFCVPA